MLALGDGVAAESEFARARAAGVPVEQSRAPARPCPAASGRPARALCAKRPSPPPSMRPMRRGSRGRASSRPRRLRQCAGPDSTARWSFRAATTAISGPTSPASAARTATSPARIQAADRAVAARPANVEALVLRGELSRGQYGLAAALPWFDRALEIDPGNVPALLERAATYGDMGRMTRHARRRAPRSTASPAAIRALIICRRCWPRGRAISRSPAALEPHPRRL